MSTSDLRKRIDKCLENDHDLVLDLVRETQDLAVDYGRALEREHAELSEARLAKAVELLREESVHLDSEITYHQLTCPRSPQHSESCPCHMRVTLARQRRNDILSFLADAIGLPNFPVIEADKP